MKLGSFKNSKGDIRIGVLINEQLLDLTSTFEKYLAEENNVTCDFAVEASLNRIPPSMLDFIRREEEGQADLQTVYSYAQEIMKKDDIMFSPSGKKLNYRLEEVKLLNPIPQAYRIFNIGVNCDRFIDMMETTPPEDGYTCMFKKTYNSLIGPEEEIKYPITGEQVESEIELGVIFGKEGKNISQEDALDYVFGYTISQDLVSMDILNKAHMGPGAEGLPAAYYITLAKASDTFQPIGPFIVTKDEIPDPQNVDMELRINGEPKIIGNTKEMRVNIRRLIEFNSADMTFLPGDLLSTGGMATDCVPHAEVKPGDTVEAEIKEIGVLRNYVVE